MSKSLWIVRLLSVLLGGPALADQCDSKAAEFAKQLDVKGVLAWRATFFR